MDKKTIVDAINKGIDDFNDQCMTMGVDSKAYHITNIECEEIKMNNMIECKTDREKMLCEQVLRMCRGEERQKLINGNWCPSFSTNLCIDSEYRAKPKKELIVPWEFLSSEIAEIVVTEAGYIKGYVNESEYHQLNGLSLDLEGIELPVAVKRP